MARKYEKDHDHEGMAAVVNATDPGESASWFFKRATP